MCSSVKQNCILYVYSNYRFGRGTQEDSHEVLRCLLSGLREEEINVSFISYLVQVWSTC